MLRLILFLAFIIALASGLAWLADRPGLIVVNWEGYQAEISVFHAVVAFAFLTGLALVAWSILRHIWESPAAIGNYFNKRRQKRGLDALSTGMIAIGAGDRATATKYAMQARKSMPNEPLTHLLRAQAAQLSGDKATARRIYESMLAATDTEQLGLRGLFLEAEREGELEAAKQFADRALALNPHLSWPVDALFDLQCKSHDWPGALKTLTTARKYNHVEKASAERRRAVLLTALAQDLEDKDPERALNLSLDAHKLAPGLVPAAAIAGRMLASRGSTPKATKILQKTWQKSPHPDLATAYAYARLGDSPRDRLDRVKKLTSLNPHSLESAIAVANTAIEAKDYQTARQALEPLLENRLTQRVCTLMARIEGEEHGDKGAVREWLARAVNAPRDPAWTADGIVSEQWSAVSPVTGALDAFQWRVPVESMEKTADEIVARKLEELVALGAPVDVAVEAKDVTPAIAEEQKRASEKAAVAAAATAQAPQVEKPAAPVAEATVVPVSESAKAKPQETAPMAKDQKAAPEPKPAAKPAAAAPKKEPAAAKPSAPERPAAAAATTGAGKTDQPAASKPAAAKVAPAKPEVDVAAKMAEAKPRTEARPENGGATAGTASLAKGSVAGGNGDSASKTASATGTTVKPTVSLSGKQSKAGTSKEEPKGKAEKSGRSGDARIFVSPRAPDDPGTEAEVQSDDPKPEKPFRMHS
jgi:HemY protein